MALNFPDSPSLNDTYTFNNKTWTWNGTAWVQKVATSYEKYAFTATAGQTTFSAVYNVGFVEVFMNGSKLSTADYTANDGTSVVLNTGASLNDIVEIIAWNLGIISGIDYVDKTGGTFTGDVTLEGKVLTTGQPSIYLDGNNPTTVTTADGDSLLTSTNYQLRHSRGGMSWDGTLGRVTVPTTGHYFVSYSFYENGSSGRVSIYKTGAALQLIQKVNSGTASASFVTEMNANEYFFINAEGFDLPSPYMGAVHTYFSAYLIG